MGKCKFCGKSAGLFSHSHKECENKHTIGLAEFQSTVLSFLCGSISANKVVDKKIQLFNSSFLTEEDLCQIIGDIASSTKLTHPISTSTISRLLSLSSILRINISNPNLRNGLDELAKKMTRGYMVEYFMDKCSFSDAQHKCFSLYSHYPISEEDKTDSYLYVLNKAAINFLSNGMLSQHEQNKIDQYITSLALPLNNLPVQYQNSEICKLVQVALLKKIQSGIIPKTNIIAPIVLGRSEQIIWVYNGVSLYLEKTHKEWKGRSHGLSFRLMKGVYYRVGQSKGHPVEHTSMEKQGEGCLYITNKHLIFHSENKAIKISYSTIISLNPYSDGIDVMKDGATTKKITFQGLDPWFIMNYISTL